ncbi:hypothetical protein ROT00_07455 [Agromyces mediolanus]|uniref:hypothetical protein n=1 Tax=Agromyces mediolanus TaxID=41986 RepID=UPI0038374C45
MNPRTPAASGTPEDAQRKYRRRQRFLRIGQAVMAAGFLVAFIHWLAHLEAFGPAQPEGWVDLVAGYPMGMLLLLTGAILASRKAT